VGDFVFAPPCAQTRRGVVEKADGAESCNFPTNFMPLNFFNERGIFCPKFCIFGGKLQKKPDFLDNFSTVQILGRGNALLLSPL